MGKSAGKAPAAPNPMAVAAAQTQSNIDTARATAGMNRVNQTNQYGSLTYTQDPSNPDRWTQTVSLNPQEQAIYDTNAQTRGKYANLANSYYDQVRDTLSRPLDLNSSVQSQLDSWARPRLDAQFGQQRAALETQLANQGVTRGSEAWLNAFRGFDQQQNDAYNQMYLNNRQQAVGEILTQRNQPLQEAQALMGYGTPADVQFAGVPQTQVAPTDVNSAFGLSQQAQQNAYQAKAQQAASTNAGVAGAASAAIMAAAVIA